MKTGSETHRYKRVVRQLCVLRVSPHEGYGYMSGSVQKLSKFANTPTDVVPALTMRMNRSGFHSLASRPHTSGLLSEIMSAIH